jgi:hypothetical protein
VVDAEASLLDGKRVMSCRNSDTYHQDAEVYHRLLTHTTASFEILNNNYNDSYRWDWQCISIKMRCDRIDVRNLTNNGHTGMFSLLLRVIDWLIDDWCLVAHDIDSDVDAEKVDGLYRLTRSLFSPTLYK